MRKLIIAVFIIGLVGSASAAEVTYQFTAEIYSYEDNAGIFSELGYSAKMPLTGTITIDPEAVPLKIHLDPYVSGAFGWWGTGLIKFENQGYEWLEAASRYLLIVNYPTYHKIEILTKQGSLDTNSDVSLVAQKITLIVDGLDASMPDDLNMGTSAEYVLQIDKDGSAPSILRATITAVTNAEALANTPARKGNSEMSADALVESACSCDADWKNHGAYVRCVTQAVNNYAARGDISQDEKRALVSKAAQSRCGKKK